jgi:hypothetical protein
MEQSRPNYWWLYQLLGDFWGGADIDDMWPLYIDTKTDDERVCKEKLIKPVILPHFERWNEISQQETKFSLRYFLSIPGEGLKDRKQIDFKRLLESALVPFPIPSDPRQFFKWIWEVLFPAEDYRLEQPEQYLEKNDLDDLNKEFRMRS